MNKAIIAGVAAIAAMTSVAAIESANVVGYQTSDQTGKNWVCIGIGFNSVGSQDSLFTMKDISASNFDEGSDTLQFLEPELARTVASYVYYDGAWYEGDDLNDGNEDTFDIGTGFLANLASGSVSLTSAGQVAVGPTQLDLSGKNWVMIGNPLPRSVKLSEIEAINFDEGSDTLQKLESDLARTVKSYVFYDGDWYEGDDLNDAGDDEIAAGEALLGNVASGAVKINFPSAL